MYTEAVEWSAITLTDRQTDGRLERLEVVVRGDLQVQTPTARNKCAMNAPDPHSGVIRLLNKAGGSAAGWLMRRLALGAAQNASSAGSTISPSKRRT